LTLWKILRQMFRFCIFARIYIFKILYCEIMSNKKLNVAIVSTMLLLATAVIAMPMKIANAQQQLSTPTNQSGISVDQQISDLKSKFPILSSSQGNEVKDIIQKIQGLDKQQALKTLAAFHILRNLQEYKEFVGSTNSGG
jgi:cell division protein FtsX